MADSSRAAGLAALAICELMLLSLPENFVIDDAEAVAILKDAAAGLAGDNGPNGEHQEAAALINLLINRKSERRRPRSTP